MSLKLGLRFFMFFLNDTPIKRNYVFLDLKTRKSAFSNIVQMFTLFRIKDASCLAEAYGQKKPALTEKAESCSLTKMTDNQSDCSSKT